MTQYIQLLRPLFLADTDCVRLVLSHIEQHLLLQRPAGRSSRPSAPQEVQAADSLRSSFSNCWLYDDALFNGWGLSTSSAGQEPQYTLFIYNSGGLLADEHSLLPEAEADSHPRRIDHRHRIRHARAHRRSDFRHLGVPLACTDDLPRHAFPGSDEAKRRLPHL